MKCDILMLPGLGDSGPQHWQTLWQAQDARMRRVEHRDWVSPDRTEWVAELDAEIAQSEGPPILVAHSLSCAAVAHWAQCGSPLKVAGAMLVAPADVERPGFPPEVTGFAPMPMARLPFPALVVASSDDEYCSIDRARAFAEAWGARFVDIGPAGHLNMASGHGPWPEGLALLRDFCIAIQRG